MVVHELGGSVTLWCELPSDQASVLWPDVVSLLSRPGVGHAARLAGALVSELRRSAFGVSDSSHVLTRSAMVLFVPACAQTHSTARRPRSACSTPSSRT